MSSESETSTLTPSDEDGDDSENGNNSDEAEEEGDEQYSDNAGNVIGSSSTPEPDPLVANSSPTQLHSNGAEDSRLLPPTAQENEFDYEEEEEYAIHLDNNDMDYEEEEEGNDGDKEVSPINQNADNVDGRNQNYLIINYTDGIGTTPAPDYKFEETEELQGEEISAGESDEEDEGKIRKKNDEDQIKTNIIKVEKEEGDEMENLEEGEIVDSDDGIPEIEGSMSPPETTDDFSKSFDAPTNSQFNKSGGYYEFGGQQPQQFEYREREREACRFFLRGNCKNGDSCQFKHTFSTQNAHISSKMIGGIRPSSYTIPVPPPIGPPISLLSTEFAPPPSLASLIRPQYPVNTNSAAWEQGLKKAREIVRRQKTTETTTIKGDDKGEENKSDGDSFGKEFKPMDMKREPPESMKMEEPPSRQFNQQQYFSGGHQNHNHRPIASRMVVEYVSVVTSPSMGGTSGSSYSQRKIGNEKSKPIPSLIDNIMMDKPMSSPSRETKLIKTKQRYGRQTFEASNYSDPWARQNSSGGGDLDGASGRYERRNQRKSTRKRRRSSSTGSSSSDGEEPSKRHVYRVSSSITHHREQEEEDWKTNNHHSSSQQSRRQNSSHHRYPNEPSKGTSSIFMERGGKFMSSYTKQEESSSHLGKSMLRRNYSVSSHTSISSSKKGDKNFKVTSPHGKQPSGRSSSVSSTTSTFTNLSGEAATLGSLLKTHSPEKSKTSKCKGPKTPPTPADQQQRPSSGSTSASSPRSFHRQAENNRKTRGNERSKHVDKSLNMSNRQHSAKLGQQKRFSRGNNRSIDDGKIRHSLQHLGPSFSKNNAADDEEEEEDAPAAYRISRKPSDDLMGKNKRGERTSSTTSSQSSSSTTSSNSSSNSSSIVHGERKNNNKATGADDVKTMVTICSSERKNNNIQMPIPAAPLSLDDEKVDPISSDDDDVGDAQIHNVNHAESTTKINGQKLEEKTKDGKMAEDGNGKADEANAKGQNSNAAIDGNVESLAASSNSKDNIRKRKFELLQKLQSVEKAIARKKQQKDGSSTEG